MLIKNVTINGGPEIGRIVGLPEQLATDITLENVSTYTDRGIALQDAADITFKNVKFDVGVGQAITTDNGKYTRN